MGTPHKFSDFFFQNTWSHYTIYFRRNNVSGIFLWSAFGLDYETIWWFIYPSASLVNVNHWFYTVKVNLISKFVTFHFQRSFYLSSYVTSHFQWSFYLSFYILEFAWELANEVKENVQFSTKKVNKKIGFSTNELKEITKSSTKEIKEENTKVAKENKNHIRGEIADVMTKLSHIEKKIDRLTQSKERSTEGQKSSPVETVKQSYRNSSWLVGFSKYLCHLCSLY